MAQLVGGYLQKNPYNGDGSKSKNRMDREYVNADK